MLSLTLFFIVMQYYFLRRGLQRVDPFFGDTQQMYRSRVLLKAEMRYVNVLVWNGVQKLSILMDGSNTGDEGWEFSKLGKIGIGYLVYRQLLGYGVAIEVPVKDLFVGYMVINIASPAPIFCRDFLTITIPL
ncbi:hypothetical protein IW262DRAFT_1481934 [Armillaria fumosa]|nr:hypothetical protein IW262DRAFT_1481934 [Armillaria fumosa]